MFLVLFIIRLAVHKPLLGIDAPFYYSKANFVGIADMLSNRNYRMVFLGDRGPMYHLEYLWVHIFSVEDHNVHHLSKWE